MKAFNFVMAGLVLLAGGSAFSQVVLSGPSQEAISKCTQASHSVVGLSLKGATQTAKKGGVPYRVTKKDGVSLALTMDYLESRLNLEVSKGKVLAARCG